MTYNEREQILSRDALGAEDLVKLLGVSIDTARKKMREIKATVGDRLAVEGKLLTDDYLKFFDLPREGRYTRRDPAWFPAPSDGDELTEEDVRWIIGLINAKRSIA